MVKSDSTTRGLTTSKLRRRKAGTGITPASFLVGCFIIAACGWVLYDYLYSQSKKVDMTYYPASKLYVDHETAATMELLKAEQNKQQNMSVGWEKLAP